MVFSSLVFLWVFLPMTLGLYWLCRPNARNLILLIASLIFYAWGEPVYVAVMLASIAFNYVCGIGIEKKHFAKFSLIAGITINLLLLGIFKYYGFLIENINTLFDLNLTAKQLPLPVGISFYTFQSISYLVDIYRRECSAQRNIVKMGLFISLFPYLIAGPILKYHDLATQLDHRRITWDKLNTGAIRFIIGLGKKVLIANVLASTADDIFGLSGQLSMSTAWIGIVAYTFQIYFDFSGYSDMAIGLGKMFGFDIPENFNRPYISQSIKEFWRRWHISLSTWFKEYVYIPLGGNRDGTARTAFNLIIVFFLTGLWHGASWNFIVWGLFHGTFLIFERFVPIEKILHFSLLRLSYTTLVFTIGWVFFRAADLTAALNYLSYMFIPNKLSGTTYFTNDFILALMGAILFCGYGQKLFEKIPVTQIRKEKLTQIITPVFVFVTATLSILLLANNTYNPFIYFRF